MFLFARCFTPSAGIIVVDETINIVCYSFPYKGLAREEDCLALPRVAGGQLTMCFLNNLDYTRFRNPDTVLEPDQSIFYPGIV